MKTSIRFVRKVYFPASFRLTARRLPHLSPPLRSCASAPPSATPPPITHPPDLPQLPISSEEARWLDSLRPWAHAVARRSGLPDADVEELLQETFLTASAKWAFFVPPPDVPPMVARRSWVGGILWNLTHRRLLRVLRERKVVLPHKDDELVDGAIDSHESSVLSHDVLRSLQHATTPERWRVSVAYASEGLSVEEIARREQRPAGTIYNLLRLARLDFAAALRREAAAARGPLVPRRKR